LKGFLIAIGDFSSNGTIQIYDESSTLVTSFKAHENQINHIKQLPNGFVATASSDSRCKIWNLTNLTLIQTYTGHIDEVYGLEYINSYTMASGALSPDMTIKIWSIFTGSTNLTIHTGSGVISLKLLSNGFYLACGLVYHIINIYNINTGSLITNLVGHLNTINDMVLISNDLLASSSGDSSVRIWNLSTNTNKYNMTSHKNSVYGLKLISSDILASGSSDKTVKLWNITSGTLLKTLYNHTSAIVWSVDLLNDGQTLVSGSQDQTIKLWYFNTGQIWQTINTGLKIRSMAVLNSRIGNSFNTNTKAAFYF